MFECYSGNNLLFKETCNRNEKKALMETTYIVIDFYLGSAWNYFGMTQKLRIRPLIIEARKNFKENSELQTPTVVN